MCFTVLRTTTVGDVMCLQKVLIGEYRELQRVQGVQINMEIK